MTTPEKNFRPTTFDDYQGQDKAKKILKIAIKAAQIKGECLDHILISGPSGTGKTTLANIIANESGQSIKCISGPAIKKVDDLIDVLSEVEENSILYADEVHSLNKKLQEILYFALEQFVIDTNIDGTPLRMDIPHFTFIGSTTELGGLEEPCRNRFPIQIKLVPYSNVQMFDVVAGVFNAMGVTCDDDCMAMIARVSRGVPRNVNSYCRRVYDMALVMNDGEITQKVVEDTFDLLDIHKHGLNSLDMEYLKYLYAARKTVGVDSIALALGTDKKSIEEVVEPWLFKAQFATKGPRGRKITQKGIEVIESL